MSVDGFERRRSHLTRYIKWRTLHPSSDSGTNGLCITALWLRRRPPGRHVDALGLFFLRSEQLHTHPVARIREDLVHGGNHQQRQQRRGNDAANDGDAERSAEV